MAITYLFPAALWRNVAQAVAPRLPIRVWTSRCQPPLSQCRAIFDAWTMDLGLQRRALPQTALRQRADLAEFLSCFIAGLGQKVMAFMLQVARRAMLVCLFFVVSPSACTFAPVRLPDNLVVGTWSSSPATGTLADGVQTATLSLQLIDPNNLPYVGTKVCFVSGDGRVQLLAPRGALWAAAFVAEPNCTIVASTDAHGSCAIDVAMLADVGDTEALDAQVFAFVVRHGAAEALWAPGTVAFAPPVEKAQLRITAASKTTSAGAPFAYTVGMYDGSGALKTNYAGRIVFESADPQAQLPAAYTFAPADLGTKTFSATFDTSGTQSLRVLDTDNPAVANTALISVLAGQYSHLALSLSPNVLVAGQAARLTLTAQDSFGNTAAGINTTAQLQIAVDANNTLILQQAFVDGVAHIDINADNNSLLMTLADTNHRLQVTDLKTNIVGELDHIEVQPAAATSMALRMAQNSNTYQPLAATLTLYDSFQNQATNYSGKILFTSSDPQAVFTGAADANTQLAYDPGLSGPTQASTYSFNANDRGTHTFEVTLKTVSPPAGGSTSAIVTSSQSIHVADSTDKKLSADTAVTVFAARNFYALALSTDRASELFSAAAGTAYYLYVAEYNIYGVQSSDAAVSLSLQTDEADAQLVANPIVITTPNFTTQPVLAFKKAGSHLLVAKSGADSSTTYSGALTIPVAPGNANVLILGGVLQTSQAGLVQSPNLTVQDAYGNICDNYQSTVYFSGGDASAVLPEAYTYTAADAGAHVFTSALQWRLAQTNNYIAATDGNINVSVENLTIYPASPNQLAVDIAPNSSCNPMSANITVQDGFSNTVTDATNSNTTLFFTDPNTDVAVPILGPSAHNGALRGEIVAGVASVGNFSLAKAGSYHVYASWQNLSSVSALSIAKSTPSISFTAATSAAAGTQAAAFAPSISYTTQGVCSATAAFNYVPNAAASGQNFMLTQTAPGFSQGSLLHDFGQNGKTRTFIWDSPNDVGFSASMGQVHALLVDSASGAILAQSSASVGFNLANQPTFVSSATTNLASQAIGVATLYDTNSDGLLDVIFGSGNQLGAALGNSFGQMVSPVLMHNALDANASVVQVAVADMDHDGAPEVVTCWNNDSAQNGALVVYSVADASTNALSLVAQLAIYCRGLVLTDFNNDGTTDVVTATADTNTLSFVSYSDQNLAVAFATPLKIASPRAVVGADVLRHGVLDYLVSSPSAASMQLVAGNPNYGVFISPTQSATILAQAPVMQTALADVNDDGFIDIVAMGPTNNGNTYVYMGDSNYFLVSGQILQQSTSQSAPFVLADLNRDGIVDLALAGAAATSLTPATTPAWFAGDGTGHFATSAPQAVSTVFAAAPLATGDIDNSGTPDLWMAKANTYASALNQGVRCSNTDPHGVLSIDLQATAVSSFVAAGDIDGDGVQDVVVVLNNASGGYNLRLLLGDSTGHFSASSVQPHNAAAALYAGVPVIADFNLDGYNDIIIPEESSAGSTVRYALGQADRTLSDFATIPTRASYLTQQLVVVDLDGDGWQDIALTSASQTAQNDGQGGLSILLSGQSPDVFPPTSQTRQSLSQTGILGVAASSPADASSNGAATNLLLWGSSSYQAYYLVNNGAGTFSPIALGSMGSVTAAALTDVNQDNVQDIVYASANDANALMLLLGQSSGNFNDAVPIAVGACQPSGLVRLALPQLGGTSFAVSCAQSGRTHVVYNLHAAAGVWQGVANIYTSVANSGGVSSMLVAADINGDGRQDLMSLEQNALGPMSPALSIAWTGANNFSSGVGRFIGTQPQAFAAAPTSSAQVQLADIDGDGALDAVVANPNTNSVCVYPGLRDGTFGAAKQSLVVPGAAQLEVGDFDHNGLPSVFVRGAAGVSVLLNHGGTLTSAANNHPTAYVPLSLELTAVQITARDVNHDGYLDVTTLRQNGVIAVYIWTPSSQGGSFGSAILSTLPAGVHASSFVHGDIAHSGDDVLVTAGSPVYVMVRDANSQTYNASALQVIAGAQALALGDVDSDGNLDLAFISSDGATLAVLKGDGHGGFAAATTLSRQALPAPATIATGAPPAPILRLVDVNRDGLLDAVIAWPATDVAAFIAGAAKTTWQTPRLYAVGQSIGNMAIGDIDNDSRPDVVFCRTGGMWPPLGAMGNNASSDSVISIMGR